jgi:tetratricopeptide (TPR) repeat protein
MARSAFHESVISCAHGMALLERLAPGPERDTLTQGLLLQELAVRIMTTGYASEATTLTAARLRDSMQERGAPTGVLPVAVLTVGRFDYVRGDFEGATACGRHGLVLAPSPDHPLALLAHTLLCCVAYQCGDYRQSVAHAEHVAAHYDVQRHGRMALDATDDPFVVTRNYGGGSLVALGLLDQARACLRTAVSTAESLAIPFCVAFAHMSGSWSYLACQDVASARRALDVTEALAGQHGFGYLVAQAATLRAWVDLLDGRARDSDGWQALLARFDAGLEAIDATGIVVGRPVLQAGQAVAAYHAGDAARAFGLLEAAIGDATNAGAWNDVMAPRITKGDLHAGRREWQAALSEYEAVVALASRLGATLYQLIATARVVRLSRATRRLPGVDRQAALTRLAEVLGGLTEGFDLPLVHEAQSLLAAAPDPAPASPRVRL